MSTWAEHFLLTGYNTFRIEAKARYFARFTSVDQLADLLRQTPVPPVVLGGGSNILLTGNIEGWVLVNGIKGIELVEEDRHHFYVRVGAGENWHGFVEYCLSRNWAGVENLSLIPGSVGAAPMQNIGAYGVELKEVFHELEAWDLRDGKVRMFTLNDCRFGYRDSIFKQEYKGRFIILNVTFRLNRNPVFHTGYGAIREELARMNVRDLSIRAISDAVIHIRTAKLPDPAVIGNAGSFFKNPTISNEQFAALKARFADIVGYPDPGGGVTKVAAGWLIEQCGWKGYRRGDAGCHDRQALVLVNYGHATGREIYDLSEDILRSVRQRFGITLEREVNII
ncbi:MAG TPA: UDP-N-acetylmuramate dehydrogenase [Puia sp.]|jgi:UDP-N-acetylmuramate dehydrogenase|nr:UDP-N-acetylmuramate dehydrogenase [Puia sp.]